MINLSKGGGAAHISGKGDNGKVGVARVVGSGGDQGNAGNDLTKQADCGEGEAVGQQVVGGDAPFANQKADRGSGVD